MINSVVMCIILNLVQEGSVAAAEFEKKAEDAKTPTKHASEAKINDIVPVPSQVTTSGSNDDIHHNDSMAGCPDNNSASQPNDSMKHSGTSAQVEPTLSLIHI